MLKQLNRFHGHSSLNFVYRHGRSVRSQLLGLKYISNPKRKACRFSVVVGKKVFKSAFKRNTVRRRIYEIIRLELPTIKAGQDVVITVFSPEIINLDHQSLVDLIKQLLSQARIYK